VSKRTIGPNAPSVHQSLCGQKCRMGRTHSGFDNIIAKTAN
jgi:hypothetical protein